MKNKILESTELEKRLNFLVMPILCDLLNESTFGNLRGIYDPLRMWVTRRLQQKGLSMEEHRYLQAILAKERG
jgi:hypothetical protein